MTEIAYQALAEKAMQFVPNPCRIGLGTGRTASHFIRHLAGQMKNGRSVVGVPTSQASAALAESLGIPLRGLESADLLDVTVDGADEVEQATLHAIKGCGGALFRERIVAAASKQQIVIVTEDKLVHHLGQRVKLPVEVLPFAAQYCLHRIAVMESFENMQPVIRGNDQPVVTDNGNWIIDCRVEAIPDPQQLHESLRAIPGVIETGLFLDTASVVLAARGDEVQVLERPKA